MTVNRLTVSREAARAFLITRQFLAPPRSLSGGPSAVMDVVRRIGSIQYDPISVAGRNHDLVLHARVAAYDPTWTSDLLYKERSLFETQNKALSLVPTDELPWYRVSWKQGAEAPRMFHAAVDPINLDAHRELASAILDRIRTDGPVSALDFESGRTSNWFGGSKSLAGAVLDRLAETGVLSLARREGNRRLYDLTERLFSAHALSIGVPIREQLCHKMLSRFRAHGLLGAHGTAFDRIGPPKPNPRRPDWPSRRELLDDLIESGEIIPVTIDGIRETRYIVRDEAELLHSATKPPPNVAFLPPYDPLLWDIPFLGKLFEFEYVLELYFPEAKRRWGYYVLPVVFRDRLVGRMEPRIDRPGDRVRILNVWWESGFDPAREDGFVDAMHSALEEYLRFAQVGRIAWSEHLIQEKKLFS